MKIIVITPVYPSMNATMGTTPVVHYFTREWAKEGHDVVVFHLEVDYPSIVLRAIKLFEKKIYSVIGFPPPTKKPTPYDEVVDCVRVVHMPIRKFIRSDRFKRKYVEIIYHKIVAYLKDRGNPDLIIGHWDSPQIELLNLLKKDYPLARNAIVFHSLKRDYKKSYKNDFDSYFGCIDTFGFRNNAALKKFQSQYFTPKRTFIAVSGISALFFDNYEKKTFDNGIHSFVFVGALIKRKHPLEVLHAISEVYGDDYYNLTYIGEGVEGLLIKDAFDHLRGAGALEMTGRIDRTKVAGYYKKSDAFIMISDNETFGLVYLEAMAMGCITIASIGGGVDGIIRNGENGFLCRPGDKEDLKKTISLIRSLSKEELQRISSNGVETARMYSDKKVAIDYLDAVSKG